MAAAFGRRAAFVARVVACCGLALLTACAATASPQPPPPLDDGKPLVVASGADLTTSTGDGIRARLIAQWNAQPGHRKAKLVELPDAADDQRSELVGALQSGTADYDVVNLDITWVPEFADSGLIRALPASMVGSDFLPQAAATGRWKGRTYAVPFNSDVGLLYYRTAGLTAASKTPADLARYRSVGDLLADVRPVGRFAYATQLRAYEGLTVNTLEAFWNAGVNLVSAGGRYTGSVGGLVAGLDELARLQVGEATTPDSLDADETASLEEFEQGGSVLLRSWPYAFDRLDASLDPSVGFGVARLPGYAALGGQSLAVAATSAHPSDAQALIRFLTDPASERQLLAAGFAASRTSVYGMAGVDCATDPAARYYDRPVRGAPEPSASSPSASGRPGYTAVLWCALQQARARPATAHYVTFSGVLQREVHRFLTRRTSAQQTAATLQAELGRALGGR
ncbi:extracellular solute-binding protein [Streptantibioticus parmotrematis]|uniref:extracellular solute-binding protein n=1 Tax=Streptantibioticus parmotrematis TaxID=2873249 RepID=UPI0033FD131F